MNQLIFDAIAFGDYAQINKKSNRAQNVNRQAGFSRVVALFALVLIFVIGIFYWRASAGEEIVTAQKCSLAFVANPVLIADVTGKESCWSIGDNCSRLGRPFRECKRVHNGLIGLAMLHKERFAVVNRDSGVEWKLRTMRGEVLEPLNFLLLFHQIGLKSGDTQGLFRVRVLSAPRIPGVFTQAVGNPPKSGGEAEKQSSENRQRDGAIGQPPIERRFFVMLVMLVMSLVLSLWAGQALYENRVRSCALRWVFAAACGLTGFGVLLLNTFPFTWSWWL